MPSPVTATTSLPADMFESMIPFTCKSTFDSEQSEQLKMKQESEFDRDSKRHKRNRDLLEIRLCVFELKSYQCVFVDGLGPGQHPQPWPDLVQKVLANLQQSSHFPIPREFFEIHLVSVRVPNPFIELLPLHHQVTIARRHNAAP